MTLPIVAKRGTTRNPRATTNPPWTGKQGSFRLSYEIELSLLGCRLQARIGRCEFLWKPGTTFPLTRSPSSPKTVAAEASNVVQPLRYPDAR